MPSESFDYVCPVPVLPRAPVEVFSGPVWVDLTDLRAATGWAELAYFAAAR